MSAWNLPQCPSCACIGEASVAWQEQDIQLGHESWTDDVKHVKVRVPVWECSACEVCWMDYVAEEIRAKATAGITVTPRGDIGSEPEGRGDQ